MTAATVPDLRAGRDAATACIADEHQELDNAQFAWTVTAVAGVLAAAGLGPGDVLGIMLPNRVELVTAMFAAWRLGAAVIPINPALAQSEARYQVDDAGVKLIVADETSARKLGDGNYRIVPVEELTSPGPPSRPVPVSANPDTLALLVYTCGTTGRPNGVMLDHANIGATANRVVAWFAMDPETRCLLVLPLLQVNEIVASVVAPLLAGGSTFIAEGFDVDAFWATVARVRPTYFSAVPPIFALLASRAGTQADTRNLRFAICSAAPMSPVVVGEFEHRYGVPVVDGYGVSECTGYCTANPVHGIRKPVTVGLPTLPRNAAGTIAKPALRERFRSSATWTRPRAGAHDEGVTRGLRTGGDPHSRRVDLR